MPRPVILLLLFLIPVPATGQQQKVQPPDAATQEKIKARTGELKAAIATLPQSLYKPDVEVYAKAGEWIIKLQEWLEPKAGEKTLAVLDAGIKRAAELKELKPGTAPSWMKVVGKPVIRGYLSEVDGSVQPYAVTIPADVGLNKRRLDVVLHGRDATLTEVKFIHAREVAKPAAKVDFFQLEVYGRGNNAYRWAGESDVWEAIRSFDRVDGRGASPWSFDPSRVVLRGFSMGGAGTWHIGLHNPIAFAAICPGAGFTTTRGYIKNLPAILPDHVERCLKIYDAIEYAENAFHVPIVAYSGEKDPQKAAADNIFNRLKDFKEPIQAIHLIAPGLEHRMPPEWQAKADGEIAFFTTKQREWPERVRFVTYTLRYADAGWAKLEALDRHYDKAMIDGKWTRNGLTIKTENIRELRLQPDEFPVPQEISIDGQKVTKPEPKPGEKSREVRLRKQEGRWKGVDIRAVPKSPEKRPGLQGPIDDAFASAFLVVPPASFETSLRYPREAVKEFERNWWKYFRGALPLRAPVEVDVKDTDISSKHLVLFGDPETNPVIAQVLPKLPIKWTQDELEVNGVKYDAKSHVPVLIYPNPLNPRKYVVINSGHTFREVDLKGTNANLYPRLGDWAVLRPMPTKEDPAAAEVVAAGLFDEYWQFPKK